MAKPIMIFEGGWSHRVFATRAYKTSDGVNFTCNGQKDDVTKAVGHIATKAILRPNALAKAVAQYQIARDNGGSEIDAMHDAILAACDTAYPGVAVTEDETNGL